LSTVYHIKFSTSALDPQQTLTALKFERFLLKKKILASGIKWGNFTKDDLLTKKKPETRVSGFK